MVAAVIRVRRRDFVSGSHNVTGFQGIAERFPRGVTIYLLPGLTGRQRRGVIRRLREEASRGGGPELPLPQLVIALFLDRVRGAIGLALAAVRFHPGVTLLPAAFVAAVMTLFVLASAGVEAAPVARPPWAAAPRPRPRAAPERAASGRAASARAAGGSARGSPRPRPGRARPRGPGPRGSASARCRGWPRRAVRSPATARPVSRL